MKRLTSAVTATFILLAAAGCKKADKAADGASILDAHCGSCHSTDFTKNTRKSQAEWEKCVTAMIDKGARLTADEKVTLVGYLVRIAGH